MVQSLELYQVMDLVFDDTYTKKDRKELFLFPISLIDKPTNSVNIEDHKVANDVEDLAMGWNFALWLSSK